MYLLYDVLVFSGLGGGQLGAMPVMKETVNCTRTVPTCKDKKSRRKILVRV
jgi:hypothetical protein